MSIETYAAAVSYFYIGLFFLSILMGAVDIWNRIRKKTLKYWWGIIPCSIFYSISAICSTAAAVIAYDDIADPNYAKYKNWGLHNFIFNDVKTFIIWLAIGILLYFVFGRKSTKKSIKTGCAELLAFILILFAVTFLLMVYH